jgi:predicted XRE-type DNA-binding protein
MLMTNITKGSDNVFLDLGFEPEEAADLKIRADLMLELREFMRSQQWTLDRAAALFDESESRLGDLMNGEIDRFTTAQLVHLLSIARG